MENQDNQQQQLQTISVEVPAGKPHKFFEAPTVKQKFQELLGQKSVGFITSLLQVVNGNSNLMNANPLSIYHAAATAASLDLPINQNLGFAWIVPYKGQAQFQLGYKGFIQLAMRTGQYSRLNVVAVYKNQFISYNELTEDLQADFTKFGEGQVSGYVAFFRLNNGFEKTVYWSMEKVTRHAKKFSKNYSQSNSIWQTDFDSMALKTVLKNTLSKWGILSIEMQKALVVDQAIINDDQGNSVTYVDNEEDQEDKSNKAVDSTVLAMKELSGKAIEKTEKEK